LITPIEIKGRKIGPGYPVYIVAEMSANHNHDFDQAIKILKMAKEIGADAVKLQTYTPDTITIRSDKKHFRVGEGTLWQGKYLYDLYGEAYTPWEWQEKLIKVGEEIGLHVFSSPFDSTAVQFLEKIQVPCYKIASFEIVDIPLIKDVASKGKPVIMSTGMATLAEIDEAVKAVRSTGNEQLALLKCTSAYPAPPEEMNLKSIPHLQKTFGLPVGLSDHTMGYAVSVAAVALGASILEKHFTLSRAHPGPDSAFSLEPDEFKAMIQAIRTTEKALGSIRYGTNLREAPSRVFRRSLFAVKDIKAGEKLSDQNIKSIRPGYGLHPRHFSELIGKTATEDIYRGTPLEKTLFSGGTLNYVKTVIIIQARMQSTRLPGKVLQPILDRPMLELMIERLQQVKGADEIVIATTEDPSCDVIEALAKRLNVGCFRGSEEDVLDRVLKAAHHYQADLIVETTGDCPVIDPETIDKVIKTFRSHRVDYCSNILKRTYPRGMDVQVFPTAVLEKVAGLTNDPVDHEHVSIYIYEHPEIFRLMNIESGLSEEQTSVRLTVDTPEDFALIKTIYEKLYPLKSDFNLKDILALLKDMPDLANMNRHIHQKAVR